jgi:hypothetical protein
MTDIWEFVMRKERTDSVINWHRIGWLIFAAKMNETKIANRTINVREITKDKLITYKHYVRESYDDVITRLINTYEGTRPE